MKFVKHLPLTNTIRIITNLSKHVYLNDPQLYKYIAANAT